MILPDQSPLRWPVGWTRTEPRKRRRSRYKTQPHDARGNLLNELSRLGAEGIILSCNLPIGERGRVLLSSPDPEDPGVAAYWVRNGRQEVMACDRWQKPWENMQALYHAVRGLRAMERSGATQVVEQAFQAFLLPDPVKVSWREILEVPDGLTPSWAFLRKIVQRLQVRYHPDNRETGDEEMFKRVQLAFQQAEAELRNGDKV